MYISTIFKIIPSFHFSEKMKNQYDFVVELLVNLVTISRFTYVSKKQTPLPDYRGYNQYSVGNLSLYVMIELKKKKTHFMRYM